MKKTFRVATFVHERANGTKWFTAYTRMYNEAWDDCVMYEVEAASGAEAKAIANKMRKEAEQRKDA